MGSAAMVYIKTDSGRTAIRDRSNGLSARARSVFLLFDGTRTLQEVLQLTSGTAEDVEKLVVMGMLARVEKNSPESASPALEEKTVPAALLPQDSGMDLPTLSTRAISTRLRTGISPAPAESNSGESASPALEQKTVPAALMPRDPGMDLPTLSTKAISAGLRTGISPALAESNSRESASPALEEKTVPAALMPRDPDMDLSTRPTKAISAKPRTGISLAPVENNSREPASPALSKKTVPAALSPRNSGMDLPTRPTKAISAKPRTGISLSAQEQYSKAHPIALRLTADLGLKGFRLNLAVEAAGDVDELRALAPTIAAAVGVEKSRELQGSLDY